MMVKKKARPQKRKRPKSTARFDIIERPEESGGMPLYNVCDVCGRTVKQRDWPLHLESKFQIG